MGYLEDSSEKMTGETEKDVKRMSRKTAESTGQSASDGVADIFERRDYVIMRFRNGEQRIVDKHLIGDLDWSLTGPEALAALLEQNEPFALKYGYDRACRWLARAVRTVKETRDYLSGLSLSEPCQETILGKLVQARLLDDMRLAEAFVSFRVQEGWSRRRIKLKLESRGVDKETVAAAMAGLDEETDARNLAWFMERQSQTLSGLMRHEKRDRLITRAQAAGFAYSDSIRAAQALLPKSEDGDDSALGAALDKRIRKMLKRRLSRSQIIERLVGEFAEYGADEDFIEERLSTFAADEGSQGGE